MEKDTEAKKKHLQETIKETAAYAITSALGAISLAVSCFIFIWRIATTKDFVWLIPCFVVFVLTIWLTATAIYKWQRREEAIIMLRKLGD